jgi:hypothetical protein
LSPKDKAKQIQVSCWDSSWLWKSPWRISFSTSCHMARLYLNPTPVRVLRLKKTDSVKHLM